MLDRRRPCIIGVAQKTWRPQAGDAPHPLFQAAEVARAAAIDCGCPTVLRRIDELDVVLPISWPYVNLCEQLAQTLSLSPGIRRLSGLSGTSPQRFLNEAAEAILRGERRAVLVCGGEAFATLKRARKEQRRLSWPHAERGREFALPDPPLPTELAHQVIQAYTTFAMLDSARRSHLGLRLDEYRRREARMMAALSAGAAHHPNAWFQRSHSADDLFAIGAGNRVVAYPFTKNTMAFMDVDMAAAVLVVSDDLADELGVSRDKRVYPHGWGHAKEPPHIAQRDQLWRCPAMETAAHNALSMAQKSMDDVQHLDLYSCFASSLNFTKDVLEIPDDDPRPLTVTGGLPYFGGPGNNYTTHSVATMVARLRANRNHVGLISGIGMHMTDHVFAVYSSQNPPDDLTALAAKSSPEQQPRVIDDVVNGPATIVAYTVLHEQDRVAAVAICELTNGHRCYARCTDEKTTSPMEAEEWVGRAVTLTCNEHMVNVF